MVDMPRTSVLPAGYASAEAGRMRKSLDKPPVPSLQRSDLALAVKATAVGDAVRGSRRRCRCRGRTCRRGVRARARVQAAAVGYPIP